MRTLLRPLGRLSEILLPASCLLCDAEVTDYRISSVLCKNCSKHLYLDRARCPRCSAILPEQVPARADGCRWCKHVSWKFASVTSVVNYEPPFASAVVKAKSRNHVDITWDLGFLLAQRLAESFCKEQAPAVVPVPMYWNRRLFRGFDHASILAKSVCRFTGWKHGPPLRCLRPLKKQSDLSFTSRQKNVRNAYAMRGTLPSDGSVLLIDDIMTTGATLSEIARILFQQGAQNVHVGVIARSTPFHLISSGK